MAGNAYDPFSIDPDFDAMKATLGRMYKQGLINLNAKKGNIMSQYGFQNQGAFGDDGKPLDFSNLQVDVNQEHGLYRDELKNEADMLDAADNGPSRGFSGGLANQAARTAKIAVAGRQNTFQQNLQQTLGGLNLEAGDQSFQYDEGIRGVNANAAEYGSNKAAYNRLNAPIVVPGSSGGGTVPIIPHQPAGALAPPPQSIYRRRGAETPMTALSANAITYGSKTPKPAHSGPR